jgi:flagellar hook-associated protein 1 FlgK
MSITSILNIATSALFASQASIQVTSNNVANADTEGYIRQTAVLTESASVETAAGLIGSGVTVTAIKAVYDKYLEASVAEENNASEEWSIYETYFGRIETILNEDNTGLSANITDFFNAWESLSVDPTNSTVLTAVVTAGDNMCQTIQDVYGELKDLQTELNGSVAEKVKDVNNILSSIAELNSQIYKEGSSGADDATLISQRTELISELSGIIDIQCYEDSNGGLTVMTSDGKLLVDGVNANELSVEDSGTDGCYSVIWNSASGASEDITDDISGGSLKALIDLRDNQITAFIDEINDLAESLATEVNSLHSSGYGANGTTGINFFTEVSTTGDYASMFAVSDEVETSTDYIAVSSTADSTSGNETALAIAKLTSGSVTIDGQSTTFTDCCASMESEIGSLSENAQDLSEYHTSLLASLETERDSVSGVSTDEEMTNLIKYQYAYQAAARLITTAESLLDALMEVL